MLLHLLQKVQDHHNPHRALLQTAFHIQFQNAYLFSLLLRTVYENEFFIPVCVFAFNPSAVNIPNSL